MDLWLAVVLIVLALAAGFYAGRGVGGASMLARLKLVPDDARRLESDTALAEQVQKLLHPPPPPPGPVRPSGVPSRVLALLQRSGRFVDFVLEDFGGAADSQIAAAIRDLHPKWQETVKKHFVLEPVLPQQEGNDVEVKAGFDPSAIQLTGNVSGNPPFKGVLRHPGWRVKEIHLPELPKGQDDLVLMPAEVEIP
jgi:Domain of unknown function (DUF2760)